MIVSALPELRTAASRAIAPRELVDIVALLEGRVPGFGPLMLIDKDADYRGPFSTENCPDIREILRTCVSQEIDPDTGALQPNPELETTVIVGPTQSYKTTILIGVGAYTIAHRHMPIGWVLPNQDPLARAFSSARFKPVVENTPWLAALKPANPDDYKDLSLGFTTCTLRFAGSNSPGNLASFPYGVVIGDETDKFPQRLKNEAGTRELLRQRTGQFTYHNHIDASTPTVPWGTIWQAALVGDCRRYHVPCRSCGRPFVQAFALLRWDQSARHASGQWDMERVARTAHLECPHCAAEIWENHRRDMLHAAAEPGAHRHGLGWIPDPPATANARRAEYDLIADPRCRSYFRSCFNVLHPNRTFAAIAQKHLLAGRDPSKRQNFTNSELGEVHEEVGEILDSDVYYKRREPYLAPGDPLPDGVLVLTAAVDVQASPARLEYEIVGHGEDFESWGIQRGYIERRTTWPAAFRELDRILLTPWPHSLGFVLTPAATCIDTGHEPEEVYRYVRACQPRRVYAVKGSSEGYGEPLVSRPRKSGVRQVTLYMVGTVTAKLEVYSRLRLTEPGPGYLHFPADPARGYDPEFFRQLTAEKLVFKWKGGRKIPAFIKPGGRANEALDIRCYNSVALALLNPAFAKLREKAGLPPKLSEIAAQPELALAHDGDPAAPSTATAESTCPEPAAPAAPVHSIPPAEPPAAGAREFDPATGRISPEPPDPTPPVAAPGPNTYERLAPPTPTTKPRAEKPHRPRRPGWLRRW